MDYESDYKVKKVGASVVQPQKEFFSSSKHLTRQSTSGSCSSRFFYGASEGVPFQWETRPGKPITAPPDDILPPLSPPPAVLSMGLPKPYMDFDNEPKPKKWSRAWLAMKIKTISIMDRSNKLLGGPIRIFHLGKQQQQQQQQRQYFGSQRYDHSGSFRSSSSSVASSTYTSSSSNSFSENRNSSSSNANNNAQSKAVMQGRPFTCNPRGLSDIVVYFVKKG